MILYIWLSKSELKYKLYVISNHIGGFSFSTVLYDVNKMSYFLLIQENRVSAHTLFNLVYNPLDLPVLMMVASMISLD